MTRARAIRLVLALIVGAALASAGAPHEQPASATSPHRAAVVVDLGDGQVRVGCVSFTEDHISGLEALDRASMSPVAQTFGGQGSAVCALCGKGCTAGSTCLTCKAPNYWAYYHDGVYSSVGSGSSQVRDGDTEGWKWGKGERPTAVPFSTVCPPTPPSTRPAQTTTRPPATAPPPTSPITSSPPTGPSGTGGGQNGPVPGNPGSTVLPGPGSRAAPPTSPASSGGTASSAPSTSAPDRSQTGTTSGAGKTPTTASQNKSSGNEQATSGGSKHVAIERTGSGTPAAASGSDDSGGTSVVSIVTFVGVLAVVAGLIVVFRRRRAGIG